MIRDMNVVDIVNPGIDSVYCVGLDCFLKLPKMIMYSSSTPNQVKLPQRARASANFRRNIVEGNRIAQPSPAPMFKSWKKSIEPSTIVENFADFILTGS